MRNILTLILMSIATVSCSSTYVYEEALELDGTLDPQKRVLVATPENGRYETLEYAKSGAMTATAVRDAFAKYSATVEIAEPGAGGATISGVDSSLYGYLVVPRILHWEDRNTEWSGKSDRVEIQLIVFDTATQGELANSSFTGASKWGTFGGDHPQDLLKSALEKIVGAFF